MRPWPLGTARPLRKHPYEYFHQFYADTITIGSVPALTCGLEFFGADRVMFATDMPFDTVGGFKYVEVALRAMEELKASADDKERVFELNARRLFGLPVDTGAGRRAGVS